MPSKTDPIHKVVLKDGSVRYRFVIDVGRRPDGKRDQRTFTFVTKREALDERAKIVADKSRGTFIRPDRKTLNTHLDEWLAGLRDLKPSTRANYVNVLRSAREQLGHLVLQELTKAHVDAFVTQLLTAGRRVGKRQTALSPRTVNLTLAVLRMALEDAVRQGILVRNVAALVKRQKMEPTEMRTWTAEQATRFLSFVAVDRLSIAWQLSLYGLRRGEVLGLRWSDIDLVNGTLTVRKIRVIVEGVVVEGEPKTDRSRRTLPLDDDLVAALVALQLQQREEAERVGDAYGSCPDCGEAHVVVNELGDLVHPESYSDRFEVLVRKSGVPPIRLHDTRHTCGTLMHLRGVQTAVISAWLGHASAAFTMATYVHSQDEAMREAGKTLTGAFASVSPTTP